MGKKLMIVLIKILIPYPISQTLTCMFMLVWPCTLNR